MEENVGALLSNKQESLSIWQRRQWPKDVRVRGFAGGARQLDNTRAQQESPGYPGAGSIKASGIASPGSSSRSGSGIGLHAAFEQSGELNFHRRKEFVIKVGNALLQGTEMRANSGGIARSIPEQRYIQERGPQPCARGSELAAMTALKPVFGSLRL